MLEEEKRKRQEQLLEEMDSIPNTDKARSEFVRNRLKGELEFCKTLHSNTRFNFCDENDESPQLFSTQKASGMTYHLQCFLVSVRNGKCLSKRLDDLKDSVPDFHEFWL